VNVVAIGERSGTLGENLGRLAAEFKKAQVLRRKAASAMVYPAFVVAATLGVALTLAAYVFPKILPMFQSLDFPLPWSTRLLMRLSGLILRRWPWLIAAAVCLALGAWRALRVPKLRAACDRAALRVPVLGRLIRTHAVSSICRVLAMLLRSGAPVDAAHQAAAGAVGHSSYKTALEEAAAGLAAGETLSAQLARTPGLYPHEVAQLVAVGERTGDLDGAFDRLARMHEEEFDDLTRDLSTLFEPLLLACMGLVVGFVAISIITPIYALTQHLGA
jgi:type IV pilus assembly protein PilC